MHIKLTVHPDRARIRRSVRARMRRWVRAQTMLGLALVAAGAFALSLGLPWLGLAVLVIGALVVLAPWLLSMAAAGARTGVFVETAEYELTEDGVRVQTRSLRAAYPWSGVQRVEDNGEFWVVVVAGTGELVLPWTLLPATDARMGRDFLSSRGLLIAV
jgi:hypothetical protein